MHTDDAKAEALGDDVGDDVDGIGWRECEGRLQVCFMDFYGVCWGPKLGPWWGSRIPWRLWAHCLGTCCPNTASREMSNVIQVPNSEPGGFGCFIGEVPREGRAGRHWTAAGLQLQFIKLRSWRSFGLVGLLIIYYLLQYKPFLSISVRVYVEVSIFFQYFSMS